MKIIIGSMSILIIASLILLSCNNNEPEMEINTISDMIENDALPLRPGPRPETTPNIPHVQINVETPPEVHEEMIRRVYSVPGIEDQPSSVLSWQGLFVEDGIAIAQPDAFLSGREFGHIHDDASLHIFLQPARAVEAVEKGWAIDHPFAIQNPEQWEGFVMLYTPQSIEELNTTFLLIVDSYNYVTGQSLVSTDYY